MLNNEINIDLNHKNILITGGAGFIGGQLALYIQDKFPQSKIVVFDCFRNGDVFSNGNLKSFGHFNNLLGFSGDIICGDLNSSVDLKKLNEFKFDFIYHQAAISDTRVEDQDIIMRTNVNSFYHIIEIAKKDNAKLIYASSAATYGNLNAPQIEDFTAPDSPYAYSKYMMDKIAIDHCNKYPDTQIVGLRYFNVYGPGEFFKRKTSSMVLQLAHQIIDGKKPSLFEGSKEIKRDFVYISDIIQANILASQEGISGIYNVGSGASRSFYDVAEILCNELEVPCEIKYIPNPYSVYQENTFGDLTKARNFLNYNPQISLENGIKSYIPYIRKTFGLKN